MSSTPIHSFATWKIKSGQLPTVLAVLKDLRAKSIQESGNLFYEVYQDKTHPCTLMLHEGYTDEAALDQHRNAKHYVELVVEKIRPLLEDRNVLLTTPLEL
jgi:(4S)-4-hydroxy-5-phosphonooxypentane-2,3-dione isomerase